MNDLRESRFTTPRDDCPHPEWWHSEDDESAETEVGLFLGGLVRVLQPEVVVESGTAFGVTALEIGSALRANGHGLLLTYETDPARATIASRRLRGLPVVLHERPFGPPFDEPIDLAYVDGHIDRRVADVDLLRDVVIPGGFVVVHDSGPQHGIRDDVEAILWLRWINLPTPRGLLIGQATT